MLHLITILFGTIILPLAVVSVIHYSWCGITRVLMLPRRWRSLDKPEATPQSGAARQQDKPQGRNPLIW